MNLPKVSILIPVYNREKYIAECIQSALNQTFHDLEIVVVDNASNDGTWKICEEYSGRDSRIRVFRNDTNIGPVRNWIRCTQEARGKYSKFLFSDDLLEPNCVERMLQPLESHNIGLVFCAAKIGTTREDSEIEYGCEKTSLLENKKYLSLMLKGCAPVSPGAVMLRTKDLLENLHTNFPTSTPRPFDRNGAGPDVMIMLLTALKYPMIACIREPLVFFRAHAGSFSIANTNNAVSDGYLSAISYYLKSNESFFEWMKYVARSWVLALRRREGWINPRVFISANEGSGTFLEASVLLLFASFIVVNKKVAKILNLRSFIRVTYDAYRK